MPNIPATYASPHLRLSLLLFDLPGTEISYEMKTGTELGIPEQFGGDGNFCVATIHFPPETGRPSVCGYKIAPARGNADEWNILCTKALGRALKKAGFPSDTKDLKTVVLWRQREAEIRAIDAGTANLQLGPAPIEQAIEASGTKTEDETSLDDGEAPVDDGIEDAILVDDELDNEIADEDKLVLMRQLIGKLPSAKQKEVTDWARKKGIRTTRSDLNHSQVDQVISFVESIADAERNGHGSEDAETIVELVSGLSASETTVFRKFCKDQGIDAGIAANAPGSLSFDDQQKLLTWLDPSR